jgi:hypothetical protein
LLRQWRAKRVLLLIGLANAGVTAVVLALTPRKYEGTMVLVPVQGAHPSAALAGAAAFLGGLLDLGSTGFDLRHALRVTTSKETGFVTMSVQAEDSGAVRAFLRSVSDQTQRLLAEVAKAQAGQLLRAQERRLDSASAELRRSEDRLLTPRSRLSLDRARLERDMMDATRVYEQVVTDRQSAIARELEEAPAIAVVEPLPR